MNFQNYNLGVNLNKQWVRYNIFLIHFLSHIIILLKYIILLYFYFYTNVSAHPNTSEYNWSGQSQRKI